MVRIGADGKVKEVNQVLTDDQLQKIVPGKTTRAEVRQLLGRPMEEQMYMPGMTWTWRFKRSGIQRGLLVVVFDANGAVKERIATIDPTDGDRNN